MCSVEKDSRFRFYLLRGQFTVWGEVCCKCRKIVTIDRCPPPPTPSALLMDEVERNLKVDFIFIVILLFLFLLVIFLPTEVFDPFLKAYIEKHHHQSVDTEVFKSFLLNYFSDKAEVLKTVDWNAWLKTPGMPFYKPK